MVAIKETYFLVLMVMASTKILGFNVGSFHNNDKGLAIYLDALD